MKGIDAEVFGVRSIMEPAHSVLLELTRIIIIIIDVVFLLILLVVKIPIPPQQVRIVIERIITLVAIILMTEAIVVACCAEDVSARVSVPSCAPFYVANLAMILTAQQLLLLLRLRMTILPERLKEPIRQRRQYHHR